MIKTLYHGTIYKIDKIDLSLGKGFKDFGKGFYTIGDKNQAIKWAKLMYERAKSNRGSLPTSIIPRVYKLYCLKSLKNLIKNGYCLWHKIGVIGVHPIIMIVL